MTYTNEDKTYFFDCACHSAEHIVRFNLNAGYVPDDKDTYGEPPEIYTSIQLNHTLPWYKRLVVALNYLLGRQPPRYGHWDCWLLKDQDINKLDDLIKEYKMYYAVWEEELDKRANHQNGNL